MIVAVIIPIIIISLFIIVAFYSLYVGYYY